MGSRDDAAGEPAPTGEIRYRGRVGAHDYEVRVVHGRLETSAVVVVDGVVCEPARRGEQEQQEIAAEHGWVVGEEEGLRSRSCPVRTLDEEGALRTEATVEIRTVWLGGAGEVDVRRGFTREPLTPDPGSASAAREERRAAHPTRFALVAALVRATGYLLPLLGVGLLLSGLLRPLREWLARITAPPREAVRQATAPVREAIAAVTEPVREVVGRVLETLFGWVPEVLGWLLGWFDLPDWLTSVLLPVLVVLAVFASTRARLRNRRQRMERARGAADAPPSRRDEDEGRTGADGVDRDGGDGTGEEPREPSA